MTYQVVITSRAALQLADAARWWSEHRSIEQAARWIDGFESALLGLSDRPEQHGLARESELHDFPYDVRQLVFGIGHRPTHRALFEVRDNTVHVLAIRHLAQDELRPDDLK